MHQGREFRVMTNAPEYDKQLERLGSKDFANPTMETQVPGNVNPRDRFQRATYFLSVLTKPTSERAGVAGMFGLIRNASIPFGAPVNGSTFDTEYRTVSNLTAKRTGRLARLAPAVRNSRCRRCLRGDWLINGGDAHVYRASRAFFDWSRPASQRQRLTTCSFSTLALGRNSVSAPGT